MKNHKRFRTPSNDQLGLTLLELVVAIGLAAIVMAGLNQIASSFSRTNDLTLVASQHRAFADATRAYIKDNYSAVMAAATATSPALIEASTLVSTGYLTTGFSTQNAMGQSMCALVLEPTANRLQALVVSEGGTAIDDLALGSLASMLGGSGGGVYALDNTTIRGAMGGWAIPVTTFSNLTNNASRRCSGAAGNVVLAAGRPAVALWFENGDTSSGFLTRDPVPGRPELNQMNTPITMGPGTVQVSSGACAVTDLGKLGRDATGSVLMCNGTIWKAQGSAFWQDPVATFAALPTCDAAAANQTRIVSTPTSGTGPRAYTCNSTAWMPLGVNDQGVLATGKVQINDIVTLGAVCTPDGIIARDTTGLILSCQSGTWKKATGGGSGLTGLYSTIGQQSLSCQANDGYGGYYIYYARIDATGMPSVRIFQYPNIFDISNGIGSSDTGWVIGQSTSLNGWGGSGYWHVILNTGGLEGYGYTFQAQRYLLCSRMWPYT